MLEQGKILQQRYRVEGQIGHGGMGAVYLATDNRFGTSVAIKETLCPDQSYYKAIEREARLLNSLKHPSLPRVSDHFVEDGVQYLVMEYIPGEDLAVMLERSGKPFPIEYLINWAEQLLDALSYLHDQEVPVIHRDIKPHNLKVTPQGQVFLLDFGLAKGNPTDASHQTTAKSIFGYSRNYAALEQIQGTGTNARSDLYSLAATLYHLSTGQPPIDALTRAMKVLARKPDPLIPAHQVSTSVPVSFSAALSAAMDLDEEARPRSAVQFQEMLRGQGAPDHFAASANSQSAATYVTSGSLDFETHVRKGPTKPQSEIPTEVLPTSDSQATSAPAGLISYTVPGETATRVASGATAAPRLRGKFAIAAAVVAAVLVLCVASVGALYYGQSALFGVGEASNVDEGQGATGERAAEPRESNGGLDGTQPLSVSQDPSGQPDLTNEVPQPNQKEKPVVPLRDQTPPGQPPKVPDTVRTEPPATDPRERPKGKRVVESVEIDRLPGGVRGVKVKREIQKGQSADRDNDDSGFRLTKIPGVFRKLPSKMRIVSPKDDKKKRSTTRQE